MERYELKVNEYGNVNGIPDGWRSVPESSRQLDAAKVPHYKACTGFEKSGKYCKPVLVNIIPDAYASVLTKWRNGKVAKKTVTAEDKKEAWCKRLDKLTGCGIEKARSIAAAKLEYKADRIAEVSDRQYFSGNSKKRDQLINKMRRENPLRRIVDKNHALAILAAHERHEKSDYESRLEYIHDLEDCGVIERGHARRLARSSINIGDLERVEEFCENE